jgi:hypothetical protein
MVAGNIPFFTIIYTSCLIICASLKEISLIVEEELTPQDLITEIIKNITKGYNLGNKSCQRRQRARLFESFETNAI